MDGYQTECVFSEPSGFFVYILWGDDLERPLYVGQSKNVFQRVGMHLSAEPKASLTRRVEIIRCATARAMFETEITLIERLRPTMNIVNTKRCTWSDCDARGGSSGYCKQHRSTAERAANRAAVARH